MALARSRVPVFSWASVLVSLSLAFFIWIFAPEAQAAATPSLLTATPAQWRLAEAFVPFFLAETSAPSRPPSNVQVSSTANRLSSEAVAADQSVRIDGSDEMRVINQALKAQFESDFPDVEVTLQANGTDAALDALLNNDIDVAAIGRPLTAEEKAKGLIEVPVSRDAIAIIIGRNNAFDGHLTLEQFAQIFRGEITNWAEVGGPTKPIRFIDRPLSSDTRLILSRYGILDNGEQPQGETVFRVESDDTADVIRLLGTDGISYAIANQVKDQPQVKLVKIAILLDTLPDDTAYPYTQVRGYAYRRGNAEAVQPFVGFANGDGGQAAIAAAKNAEANAVKQALQPQAFRRTSGANDTPFGDTLPFWLWGIVPLFILLLVFARNRFPSTELGEDSSTATESTSQSVDSVTESVTESAEASTLESSTPIATTESDGVDIADTAAERSDVTAIASPEDTTVPPSPAETSTLTDPVKTSRSDQPTASVTPVDADEMLTWIDKGTALLGLGRYEEAIACFDRATPMSVDAWIGRGDALTLLGRTSEGEASYAQAATLRAETGTGTGAESGAGSGKSDRSSTPLVFDDPSDRQAVYRRLTVHSQSASYILDQAQMVQLQTPDNATQLSPGTYFLRIHSGSFSDGVDNPRFDPEPWVVLRLYGGRVVNKSTNVEVSATWVTLNGYDDVLKIQVIETISLCAMFMDTSEADHSGRMTLSVLNAD